LQNINFDIFTSFTADNFPENVRILGMVANLPQYMKSADLVITQAGHSTAMELMTLGKPSIIIPDFNQIEQENNANKMKALEVAEIISHKELNCDKLISAIQLMLNTQKYSENAAKFALMAKEIRGRESAAQIIKDYSARLRSY